MKLRCYDVLRTINSCGDCGYGRGERISVKLRQFIRFSEPYWTFVLLADFDVQGASHLGKKTNARSLVETSTAGFLEVSEGDREASSPDVMCHSRIVVDEVFVRTCVFDRIYSPIHPQQGACF